MVIEVKPEQPENARLPMDVTLLGMIVFLHPAIKVLLLVSMMALQLLRESYFVLPFSTTIEVKPEQPKNALLPIDVTLLEIVIEVKPEQSRNAPLPMDVTLLGMVIEVKPEQLTNAELPIDVTLLGIVIEVKPEHPANAALPMDVKLLGIVIEVTEQQ